MRSYISIFTVLLYFKGGLGYALPSTLFLTNFCQMHWLLVALDCARMRLGSVKCLFCMQVTYGFAVQKTSFSR